jgi:hypothetical protein
LPYKIGAKVENPCRRPECVAIFVWFQQRSIAPHVGDKANFVGKVSVRINLSGVNYYYLFVLCTRIALAKSQFRCVINGVSRNASFEIIECDHGCTHNVLMALFIHARAGVL